MEVTLAVGTKCGGVSIRRGILTASQQMDLQSPGGVDEFELGKARVVQRTLATVCPSDLLLGLNMFRHAP